MKITVLNPSGERLYTVHEGAAIRMLERSQARLSSSGRALQLIGIGQVAPSSPAGRTRTSRGGMLAAIGRSQVYTTADRRGQVTGFKTIYVEDRNIFRSAVIECVVKSYVVTWISCLERARARAAGAAGAAEGGE